jgi:hypothetical protein
MPSKHHVCEQNDVATTMALTAIATYPTFEQASEFLKEDGINCSVAKLEVIARLKRDELEQLRDKAAPLLEREQANNMLGVAQLATIAENVAIQRCLEKLQDGTVADPSKVARDLADVKAKNIDKRLALQGRPTVITQDRSIEELTRALVSMKVAEVVDVTSEEDPPAQLPPAA